MVSVGVIFCPNCNGDLKFYDKKRRIVRTKRRKSKWIKIRRLQCSDCNGVHCELPECLLPYKQYEAEVIFGVLEGFITPDTLGYEDYPCEMTMKRWKNSHTLCFPKA